MTKLRGRQISPVPQHMNSLPHYQHPLLEQTHVLQSMDLLSLSHHHHPESAVYIRGHSWCFTSCRFGWVFRMYISSSQVLLLLLCGQHFESHCSASTQQRSQSSLYCLCIEVAHVTSLHLLLVELIFWTTADARVQNVAPRVGSPTLDGSSRNLGCHLPIRDTPSRSPNSILLQIIL